MLLGRRLKKAGIPLARHNIWDEPDAATFVRSVANGNETVPTVVIGDRAMVNPSAKQVIAALGSG
jgi:glutaredoxin